MKRVRVLIVDDHALFREGLRSLLAMREDLEVVGEALDGEQAVRLAVELKPDIVLMDLRLARLSGVEATRRISAAGSDARIIVLTTFEEELEIFGALRAGAIGYLLKASPSAKLFEAITLAARGETFLEPSVAAKVVAEFARQSIGGTRAAGGTLSHGLSAREIEVLRCLADGMSNKEIGVSLRVASGTVKNHLSAVFSKLGVLDRTQAALKGRELGLL